MEIVIAILIAAVLIAALVGPVQNARENATEAWCTSHLRQLANGVLAYAQERLFIKKWSG